MARKEPPAGQGVEVRPLQHRENIDEPRIMQARASCGVGIDDLRLYAPELIEDQVEEPSFVVGGRDFIITEPASFARRCLTPSPTQRPRPKLDCRAPVLRRLD